MPSGLTTEVALICSIACFVMFVVKEGESICGGVNYVGLVSIFFSMVSCRLL